MSEYMLDILGDYFYQKNLINRGWEFHEFVEAWQQGYIALTDK